MTTLHTKNGIHKILRGEPHYPLRLNDLYDPPACIYVSGNIAVLSQPMIAIVGSRMASTIGLRNARLFAGAMAKAGAVVISGLARGIDGGAHAAALEVGPKTIAVCGTGLDITYPKEHLTLAEAIRRNGLLISEFAPGVGPQAHHFPKRNRIIAALALGVVVIEAAQKSGSLITARFAADLGREVFALPGAIDDPLHEGCHQLINQGAQLVCTPKDVLDSLNLM